MKGTLALVGAGEFLDTMDTVDRVLLERAGEARVVVLPTASARDGPGVPERWAKMGVEHFNRLGAQTQAVMALDRAGCSDEAMADQVRGANLVYFSGGKPDYLLGALADTLLWQAVKEVLDCGGVVAGCSAGAMIMGGYVPAFSMRLGLPKVGQWRPALGLVPKAVLVPHYNEFPEAMVGLMFGRRPAGSFLIGVDADTALVGSDGDWQATGRSQWQATGRSQWQATGRSQWQVMGARRVTLRRGRETQRYTHGQTVTV